MPAPIGALAFQNKAIVYATLFEAAAYALRTARALDPPPGSLLLIENVGNLVCPAMFDLGETMKIAVISTTEGEDKPLKYPHMFRAVKIVIVNKMDLAPHVGFDEAACCNNIRTVNPSAEIICLSAKTGQNLEAWLDKLKQLRSTN